MSEMTDTGGRSGGLRHLQRENKTYQGGARVSRRISRLIASVSALAVVGVGLTALPASAADGDPFAPTTGTVWIAQHPNDVQKTTLYTVTVNAQGEFVFDTEGVHNGMYNAIGFNQNDNYLYGIVQSANPAATSNKLVKIGQGGKVVSSCNVTGLLTGGAADYNQGAFDPASGRLLVRRANDNKQLYSIDVNACTATTVTLSQSVPNLSDFVVMDDGFAWSVYGEGSKVYRIDTKTGAVSSWPITGLPKDPYGAQWVYGNGNLGISNNITGTIYQVTIANSTSANPTFGILAGVKGPRSLNNDGTSFPGQPTDLGLHKEVVSDEHGSAYLPGDTLTYKLTVHNYGPGNSSGYIVKDDDFFAGLTNLTVVSSPGHCEFAGHVLTCSGPPLAAGADAEPIVVTAKVPSGLANPKSIENTATVTGNERDPDPGNNSDDADIPPLVQAPSFVVSKEVDKKTALPGETVTYTIKVVNNGDTDLDPATFTDDLSAVLDNATYVSGSASPSAGTAIADTVAKTLSWSGPLKVGAQETITYQVKIKDRAGLAGTDWSMKNVVVPGDKGSCVTDCSTTTDIESYTVKKAVDKATALPGETVTYSITVRNVGKVAYTSASPATFEDSLAAVLDDATYNNDASDGGLLVGDKLTWSVPLGVGESHTVTYSVTVKASARGNNTLTNVVIPTGDGGVCTDAADCTTTTDVPPMSYVVSKKASTAQAKAGDKVSYTVTVENTGKVAYTDANPASFSDNLVKVLVNATYNNDASGGATYTNGVLAWSGPLAVGERKTITYSVTVGDKEGQKLVNVVVPTGSNGTCLTATSCSTTTDTPPTDTPTTPAKNDPKNVLPLTGGNVAGVVGIAALLTALGLGLAFFARRAIRQRNSEA